MWEQLKRVIKPNGAIVMTASQPFTTTLIASNMKMFKYCWVWEKNNSAGFATAKIRPFIICEDVVVFGTGKINYYPQMETRGKPRTKGGYSKSEVYGITPSKSKSNIYYPKNLLHFGNASQKGKVHPTQKPVKLFEYLMLTYTNEGETVLDFASGSGTCAIAADNLKRNWICIEKDKGCYEVSKKRINENRGRLNEMGYNLSLID
jgi:site-specific DNA-methyltransferase (adenine-specific)